MIIQDYPESVQTTLIILFYLMSSVAIASILEFSFSWITKTVKRLGGLG